MLGMRSISFPSLPCLTSLDIGSIACFLVSLFPCFAVDTCHRRRPWCPCPLPSSIPSLLLGTTTSILFNCKIGANKQIQTQTHIDRISVRSYPTTPANQYAHSSLLPSLPSLPSLLNKSILFFLLLLALLYHPTFTKIPFLSPS